MDSIQPTNVLCLYMHLLKNNSIGITPCKETSGCEFIANANDVENLGDGMWRRFASGATSVVSRGGSPAA
jgi:hypothetical protein